MPAPEWPLFWRGVAAKGKVPAIEPRLFVCETSMREVYRHGPPVMQASVISRVGPSVLKRTCPVARPLRCDATHVSAEILPAGYARYGCTHALNSAPSSREVHAAQCR